MLRCSLRGARWALMVLVLAAVVATGGCRRNVAKTVAVVDGQDITADDVLRDAGTALRTQAALQAVHRRLLENEAKRHGIKLDESLIDAQIAREQQEAGGPEQFLASLQQQREILSIEDYRQALRQTRLMYMICTRDVVKTEEEIRAFYDQNPERFGTPAQLRLSILQVPTREAAEKAIARVKAGESFGAVVDEVSENISPNPGGDLGWVPASMANQIPRSEGARNALASLKVGEMTQPYDFQWYNERKWEVFYLQDKREADVPAYEEVRDLAELYCKMNDPAAESEHELTQRLFLEHNVQVVGDGFEMLDEWLRQATTRQAVQPGATTELPPAQGAAVEEEARSAAQGGGSDSREGDEAGSQ